MTRFGRNSIDAGYYLEKYLPSLGVRFVEITDDYDSNDGDGGILLPLKNIISESYALDISRKCRSVQQQNIKSGRFVGRMAPYGYAKSPEDCHQLVIDEKAASTVQQIFEWSADGAIPREIVRKLNEQKVLTPSRYKQANGIITSEKLIGTELWTERTVKDMLSDRVYVGDMVQGKTRKTNHKQVFVDPSEWVCVPNTHEPIIDRAVFDEVNNKPVQKLVEPSKRKFSENNFKGKVFCVHCGYAMNRKLQYKDGAYWFRCETRHKYGKDACVQVSVKESDVVAEIIAMLHEQAEVLTGRYIQLERSQSELSETASELKTINAELNDNGRYLKSLYENMVSGIISADEFRQMKSDYEAKIQALSARANEIRDTERNTKSQLTEYRDLNEAVSVTLTNNALTVALIEKLVDRVSVRHDKSLEIRFSFKDEFGEGEIE